MRGNFGQNSGKKSGISRAKFIKKYEEMTEKNQANSKQNKGKFIVYFKSIKVFYKNHKNLPDF